MLVLTACDNSYVSVSPNMCPDGASDQPACGNQAIIPHYNNVSSHETLRARVNATSEVSEGK